MGNVFSKWTDLEAPPAEINGWVITKLDDEQFIISSKKVVYPGGLWIYNSTSKKWKLLQQYPYGDTLRKDSHDSVAISDIVYDKFQNKIYIWYFSIS